MSDTNSMRRFHREVQVRARIKAHLHCWWHLNFCETCKARAELGEMLSGGLFAALQGAPEEAPKHGGSHGRAH